MVPTVVVYTRHSVDCVHAKEATSEGTGEFARDCSCRKWVRYHLNGKQYRFTAKTSKWAEAEKTAQRLRNKFSGAVTPEDTAEQKDRKTVAAALVLFKQSKKNSGLGDAATKKYKRELEGFQDFLAEREKLFVDEINGEILVEFVGTWEKRYPSTQTRAAVRGRLRAFLRYANSMGWIKAIPQIDKIKINVTPTLPLDEKQYLKLLETIPQIFENAKARKVRALVQLMKHSGLAIMDAVSLERGEIQKDTKCYRIVTARTKTGVHVSVPIPDDVAKEILAVLNGNPRYVFWNTGNGKVQSVVTNWQHDLRTLFRTAFGNNTDFTPHSLRDTFAVDLLRRGVSLKNVSRSLGHESVKTTEKSYLPWVKGLQDNLDDEIMGTW